MPRMITEGASRAPKETATIADERGIGCGKEYISFSFPEGGSYVCDKEKALAELILDRNQHLWPAVVIFPSGLRPQLLYAQCTFKYESFHEHNYKEAGGINNFLSKGCLLEFLREYNIASLIVAPWALADNFYSLDEPRIEESLFVIESDGGAVTRYKARHRNVATRGWSPTYQFSLTPTGAPFCGSSLGRDLRIQIPTNPTLKSPPERPRSTGSFSYSNLLLDYKKSREYPASALPDTIASSESSPPQSIHNRNGMPLRLKVLVTVGAIALFALIVWRSLTR
jgi:hypothetical protein